MRPLAAALAVLASLPACSDDSCFVGDTLVATPQGPRRIAELTVGDAIYSVTPDGERVAREVTAIRPARATTVCRVVSTPPSSPASPPPTPSTTPPATPTSPSAI